MKIRPTEFKREDNQIHALETTSGQWMLRSIFGVAFFWEPRELTWEPATKFEKFNTARYEVSFGEAMRLLETLQPYTPPRG